MCSRSMRKSPAAFDEGDVGFLTTYANMIGMALARYEAEQKALREAQERTRADALWETLVREMQHRVKNNLQTIISFLSLQRRQADTPRTPRAWRVSWIGCTPSRWRTINSR